jgi:O-6-methylguanine DNA methyltransferase
MAEKNARINCEIAGTKFVVQLSGDGETLTGCWMLGRRTAAPEVQLEGVLAEAAGQLQAYFAGETDVLDVALSLKGSEFQQRVWDAARTIPAGEVRSYSWLAQKVGNPRAVRAVASALGANPALLFVPCHRVLRSNGDLGGFSCGLEWKQLLLAHEKSAAPLMV